MTARDGLLELERGGYIRQKHPADRALSRDDEAWLRQQLAGLEWKEA